MNSNEEIGLIHRLTYRRTNQKNLHVRSYKEEGTITTAFDMTVLLSLPPGNGCDRSLAADGRKGNYLQQKLQDKSIEHKQYIYKHGENLPGIPNWNGNSQWRKEDKLNAQIMDDLRSAASGVEPYRLRLKRA